MRTPRSTRHSNKQVYNDKVSSDRNKNETGITIVIMEKKNKKGVVSNKKFDGLWAMSLFVSFWPITSCD